MVFWLKLCSYGLPSALEKFYFYPVSGAFGVSWRSWRFRPSQIPIIHDSLFSRHVYIFPPPVALSIYVHRALLSVSALRGKSMFPCKETSDFLINANTLIDFHIPYMVAFPYMTWCKNKLNFGCTNFKCKYFNTSFFMVGFFLPSLIQWLSKLSPTITHQYVWLKQSFLTLEE